MKYCPDCGILILDKICPVCNEKITDEEETEHEPGYRGFDTEEEKEGR